MKKWQKILIILCVTYFPNSKTLGANNEASKLSYGNISVKSAEVRGGPSRQSKLVGYLPGPTGVILDVSSEKSGWLKAGINWNYKGNTWVRRHDVVFKKDFKKYDGNWPIEYYLAFGEGGLYLVYFQKDNRCNFPIPNNILDEANKLRSEYDIRVGINKNNSGCDEVWYAPGTSIIRFDNNEPLSDQSYAVTAWKEGNQIIMTTYFGGNYTFKFRDGKVKNIDIECKNGRELGCPPLLESKPAKKISEYRAREVNLN